MTNWPGLIFVTARPTSSTMPQYSCPMGVGWGGLVVARHRSFSGAARDLGVSRSAVSQAVRQLEEQLHVVLLVRTTRSVSLTDPGKRLVEGAGPALGQALATLTEISAQPGETVGRVRLTVPRVALPFVIDPVLPAFRA